MQMSTTRGSSDLSSAQPKPAGEKLDTRGMAPPEPILAILRKVSELPNGAELEVRLDSQPMQLYDLLQQRGFFLLVEQQSDGSWAGRIQPRDHAPGH